MSQIHIVPTTHDHATDWMLDFERQQFFWSRTRKEGDHLLWTGAHTPRGYGKMFVAGRLEYAHRVAWCISHNCDLSEINHLTILKTCEVTECVAPEHLIAKAKKGTTRRTKNK